MTLANFLNYAHPADTQSAELRVVATSLWDCAARVAAGGELDDLDRRGLRKALALLEGASPNSGGASCSAVPSEGYTPSPGQVTFAQLIIQADSGEGTQTRSDDDVIAHVIDLIESTDRNNRSAAREATVVFKRLVDLTDTLGASSRPVY